MNECCSTNYSTIALTEESTTDAEKIITWTDGHKIGQLTKKEVDIRGDWDDELLTVARIIPF